MSFDLNEFNGYKKGERYKKRLTFLKSYGNVNNRYVEFKDEDGNILSWQTCDRTKTYKNLKYTGQYLFTVDFIFNNIDKTKVSINIKYLKETSNTQKRGVSLE